MVSVLFHRSKTFLEPRIKEMLERYFFQMERKLRLSSRRRRSRVHLQANRVPLLLTLPALTRWLNCLDKESWKWKAARRETIPEKN